MPTEFRRRILPALWRGEGGCKDLHNSYFVWRDAKRLSVGRRGSRRVETAVAPLHEWIEFGDYRDRRPRGQERDRQSDPQPSNVGTAGGATLSQASAEGPSSDRRRSAVDGRRGDLVHLSAGKLKHPQRRTIRHVGWTCVPNFGWTPICQCTSLY